MTEKKFTIKRKNLKVAKILENGEDLTGYFFVAQAKFLCEKLNELNERNADLMKENYGFLDEIAYKDEVEIPKLSEQISDLEQRIDYLEERLKLWREKAFTAHEYFNCLEKVIDDVCNDDVCTQIWAEYEKKEKLIE